MKAILKNATITSRKAQVIRKLIIGKETSQALDMLRFMNKKGAKILYKIIASAVANAKNNHHKDSELVVKNIHIYEGMKMRRHRPISRGRARPFLKRFSHIHVELT